MYDIIIIGAGTAGMTAAVYSARANKNTLVIEQSAPGGQIINAENVENYPGIKSISGVDFSMALYEQATLLGGEFVFAQVTSVTKKDNVFFVETNDGSFSAKAVIIATGAKNRPLGLQNETKLTGRGVSYCATCDGAFYKGKTTVVVGGGNTAIDDALFLSNLCSKVYVIHRRDTFRGERLKVESMLNKENIQVITNSVVTAINGTDKIESVTLQNKLDEKVTELQTDGLFIAVGQMPQNKVFEQLVDLDGGGYIVATEDCKTKTEGLFACGDCRTKAVRQLSTAAADGTVSAVNAIEYTG